MNLDHVDKTALLVIDVQQSFRHRPYFSEEGLLSFFERSRRLIDGFQTQGLPVIRILHIEPEGAFSKASGHAVPMAGLSFTAAATFEKRLHSALVGTGLDRWLGEHRVTRLAVSGIRTEQCCETTTRHASDLGFEVDYATEATMTWPMMTRTGRTVSAEEIRERTEMVLSGRFASIVTVDEAIDRARSSLRAGADITVIT